MEQCRKRDIVQGFCWVLARFHAGARSVVIKIVGHDEHDIGPLGWLGGRQRCVEQLRNPSRQEQKQRCHVSMSKRLAEAPKNGTQVRNHEGISQSAWAIGAIRGGQGQRPARECILRTKNSSVNSDLVFAGDLIERRSRIFPEKTDEPKTNPAQSASSVSSEGGLAVVLKPLHQVRKPCRLGSRKRICLTSSIKYNCGKISQSITTMWG